MSAIARGVNASITAQDKRFERQLKESAERERRLLEFRASEAKTGSWKAVIFYKIHELRLPTARQSQATSRIRRKSRQL